MTYIGRPPSILPPPVDVPAAGTPLGSDAGIPGAPDSLVRVTRLVGTRSTRLDAERLAIDISNFTDGRQVGVVATDQRAGFAHATQYSVVLLDGRVSGGRSSYRDLPGDHHRLTDVYSEGGLTRIGGLSGPQGGCLPPVPAPTEWLLTDPPRRVGPLR